MREVNTRVNQVDNNIPNLWMLLTITQVHTLCLLQPDNVVCPLSLFWCYILTTQTNSFITRVKNNIIHSLRFKILIFFIKCLALSLLHHKLQNLLPLISFRFYASKVRAILANYINCTNHMTNIFIFSLKSMYNMYLIKVSPNMPTTSN